MNQPLRSRLLAAASAMVLLGGALLLGAQPASARPASARPAVGPANLLTAHQMAQGSSRDGWHVVPWSGVFDCGSVAVMESSASDRARRAYASDTDASGFHFVGAHRGTARARAAFVRALTAIRTCVGSIGTVRVRADEELVGLGRNRLVQLVFRTRCCGTNTHTFGVIRRGSRTAVVKIGEMGVSPVGPMRGVILTASDKLTN